jgi:hypothetical protein
MSNITTNTLINPETKEYVVFSTDSGDSAVLYNGTNQNYFLGDSEDTNPVDGRRKAIMLAPQEHKSVPKVNARLFWTALVQNNGFQVDDSMKRAV